MIMTLLSPLLIFPPASRAVPARLGRLCFPVGGNDQETHDRFLQSELVLQLRTKAWFHLCMEQHILSFALFVDLVGKFAFSPNLGFFDLAPAVCDPPLDLAIQLFKSFGIQVGVGNVSYFIIAHKKWTPSTGLPSGFAQAEERNLDCEPNLV